MQPPRPEPPFQFSKFQPPPRRNQEAIGKPCAYCTKRMHYEGDQPDFPTRDHAFPRSAGWTFRSFNGRNRVMCCWRCNHDKDNTDIVDWHAALHGVLDPRANHVYTVITEIMAVRASIPPKLQAKLARAQELEMLLPL